MAWNNGDVEVLSKVVVVSQAARTSETPRGTCERWEGLTGESRGNERLSQSGTVESESMQTSDGRGSKGSLRGPSWVRIEVRLWRWVDAETENGVAWPVARVFRLPYFRQEAKPSFPRLLPHPKPETGFPRTP